MGIEAVYIVKNEDDVRYEVLKDYPKASFFDAKGMSEQEFINLHSPSLLAGSKLRCIVNVDEIDIEVTLDLIPKVKQNVIWCFGSLPKTRKVYKELNKFLEIKTPLDLSKKADKTKFIKDLSKKYGVPTSQSNRLSRLMPDSKEIIDREFNKLSVALEVLPEEEAMKCVSGYEASYDLLNYVNYLFSNPEEAYFYSEKVSISTSPFLIGATLLKRIKYYIYLSINDYKKAATLWHSNDYFMRENAKEAKAIGFNNLLKLYDLAYTNLLVYYKDNKDLRGKLDKIVYFCERINEDNNSRR